MIHIRSGRIGLAICGARAIYRENFSIDLTEISCRKCLLLNSANKFIKEEQRKKSKKLFNKMMREKEMKIRFKIEKPSEVAKWDESKQLEYYKQACDHLRRKWVMEKRKNEKLSI